MITESGKHIEIVGDRVLILPDKGEERTAVGLYLPRPTEEKTTIMGGVVREVGPGLPLPDLTTVEDEPWKSSEVTQRYVNVQARVGDYAVFLRKSAVEIRIEGIEYMVLPQSAILVLMRDHDGIGRLGQS